MKLKDCKHGVLVKTRGDTQKIGMIIGISNNSQSGNLSAREDPDNTIPLIQWASGTTHTIHYGNIDILK